MYIIQESVKIITRKISKKIELNGNENTIYKNLWETGEAVLM